MTINCFFVELRLAYRHTSLKLAPLAHVAPTSPQQQQNAVAAQEMMVALTQTPNLLRERVVDRGAHGREHLLGSSIAVHHH